jgi:hypothetical protein
MAIYPLPFLFGFEKYCVAVKFVIDNEELYLKGTTPTEIQYV